MLSADELAILNAFPFVPSTQTLYYVGWRSFHNRGYVVAYLRERDLVGVVEYETCSCNDTDELFQTATWGNASWKYLGSTAEFYPLCKGHRDFALPAREVSEDDYNAKWVLKLQDVFVEWVDAGKPRWEEETPKRAHNAIRGGKVDQFTVNGERPGTSDMASFARDTAIRDADKRAGIEMVKKMQEQGLDTLLIDGQEVPVRLSAGRTDFLDG
jgi:hypothetical protein